MEKTFTVSGISCGHCVNSVKNELEELDGVFKVTGDPEKKEINVESVRNCLIKFHLDEPVAFLMPTSLALFVA